MKQTLTTAFAVSLLLLSCKKKSNTPTSTPTTTTSIPADGWKLGANSHKQLYCLRQADQFAVNCVDATTGNINSFAVFFKAYPTGSGTYHIVKLTVDSAMTYPGSNIGASDIIVAGSIPTGSGSSNTYWSIGTEGKDATVTITGGKIKVEVPEVRVVYNADTLTLTGTMIEN